MTETEQPICYQTVCTTCRASGCFALHEVRARGLRYIVQNIVVLVSISLARWKCRNCGRTFTDYPFFVLPYKRFATPCLIERSKRFMRDSKGDEDPDGDQPRQTKVGYRNAVMHNRQRIGYPVQHAPSQDAEASTDEPSSDEPSSDEPSTDEPSTDEPSIDEPSTDEASIDEPSIDEPSIDEPSIDEPSTDEPSFHQPIVDHSLVWRMVGWLGGLTWVLDKACEMILQRNPNSLCHRYTSNVNPDKARSPHRQATLETADHLLHVIEEWEATFGEKFFPRFATRSGFD